MGAASSAKTIEGIESAPGAADGQAHPNTSLSPSASLVFSRAAFVCNLKLAWFTGGVSECIV